MTEGWDPVAGCTPWYVASGFSRQPRVQANIRPGQLDVQKKKNNTHNVVFEDVDTKVLFPEGNLHKMMFL